MKRFGSLFTVFSGFALFAVAVVPGYATEVMYNTVGAFDCHGLAGCTVTSLGGGDSEVVVTSGANTSSLIYSHVGGDFTPDVGDTLSTNFSAGVITPGATNRGVSLNGITLDIQVLQSIPTPAASGDFLANITGSTNIGSNSHINSTAIATFAPALTAPPSITLDDVTYTLDNDAYKIAANFLTSVQGSLDATALPEPAFFTLTGIGFFGMFAIALSRYKSRYKQRA